uniref:Uncharacterized protein n=1 Tax=Strigamia maritima TaxID=126957 RepID=T1ITG9_STRMM
MTFDKKVKRDQVNIPNSEIPGLNLKNGFVYNFLWILLISFSSLGCSYQIYDRFSFYLSRPIGTKVNLIRNESVKFPSLTVCPDFRTYTPLINMRKQKAKERNLQHFCHVHPTTLLDDTHNITTIWDLMSLNGTLNVVFEYSVNCDCTNNQTRTKRNKQMNKKSGLLKNCNILLFANKLLTWMTKHYRKYNEPMKIKMDAAHASNCRTMRMCEVLCTLCRAFKSKLLRAMSGVNVLMDLPSFSRKNDTKSILGTCNTYSYKNLVRFQKDDFILIFTFLNNLQHCSRGSIAVFMLHNDDDIVTYKIANRYKEQKPINKATYGLSAKRFKILNETRKPCDTNQVVNECEKNCFENALKNITQCRLPMTSYVDVPLCANGRDANVVYNQLLNLAVSFDYEKQCICPKICDEILYTDHFKMIEEYHESWLLIYFDNNVIEEIEEYYSYLFISFICDFGGNLGLFLGLSIPAIFQLGESIIAAILKTIRSKN